MKQIMKSCAAIAFALAVAVPGSPAMAQEDDESGMPYLQAMSDSLKNAEAYAFTAGVFFDETSPTGLRAKRYAVYDVAVKHPDQIAWSVAFDDGTVRRGAFDGKTVTFAQPANKAFTRIAFEGSIDELIDNLHDNFGIGLPIADFVYSDVMEAQKPYIISATDLGERAVPNSTARHILVEGTAADWQVWIEQKEHALPLRFVATYVRQLGDPEYMITFWKWTLNNVDMAPYMVDVPSDWTEVQITSAE